MKRLLLVASLLLLSVGANAQDSVPMIRFDSVPEPLKLPQASNTLSAAMRSSGRGRVSRQFKDGRAARTVFSFDRPCSPDALSARPQ